MNICLLSAQKSIHTARIANGYISLGHKVLLVSLPNHRDDGQHYVDGVTIHYLKTGGTRGYFQGGGELKQLLKEHSIDILHAHYASGYGTLGAACGFHPYVLSVWGSDVYDFPHQGFLKKKLLVRNLKKADALFSTSHIMAKRTSPFVPGREITVTPFGVDIKAFSPSDKADKAEGPLRIAFIKKLSQKYGPETLVRALSLVKKDMPDLSVELLMYGGGDQEEFLKSLSDELGIGKEVIFGGFVMHDKVPDLLRRCALACLPSNHESFGVAAVEAMACGIPCITSDADGFTEVMDNNVTGFVVPRENPEALAEKLVLLLKDSELRKRMGAAGRERVCRLYDWEDNIRTMEQALIKVFRANSVKKQHP